MNEEDIYYIMYKCLNCGSKEEKIFTKGTLAPKDKVFCKNCGCEEMVKVVR